MITSSLLRVLMVLPLFNIDDFRLKSLNLTLTLLLILLKDGVNLA
jgi:hypothetical protein